MSDKRIIATGWHWGHWTLQSQDTHPVPPSVRRAMEAAQRKPEPDVAEMEEKLQSRTDTVKK